MLHRAIAGLMIAAPIAIALTAMSVAQTSSAAHATKFEPKGTDSMPADGYVGMWVTADGHIRHELLPNGRYDEARGGRKSAYQGRYTITGNHIDYIDDTGFTADGDFIDGVLHHAGMLLTRAK